MSSQRRYWIVVVRARRGQPLGGFATLVEAVRAEAFSVARQAAREWLGACWASGGIELYDVDPLALDYDGRLPLYAETVLVGSEHGQLAQEWPSLDFETKLEFLNAHLRRLEMQSIAADRRVDDGMSAACAAA
jgi:hypothetical protein